MNRRGELTSQQIVTIVILIISFTIILIFFLSLNLRSGINNESCKNSVALRGSSLGKGVSLNCKTQDICLSNGGECNEAGGNAVKLKVKNQGEFKEELANLMYACWNQMGEGKVDYLPTNYGTEANYCAICNRIYVDESIRNKGWGKISVKEYYAYLADKKTPDGKTTMLNYLHGLSSLDSVFQSLQGKVDVDNLYYDFGNKQGYALVTSTAKGGWLTTIVSAGATAAAVATIVGVSISSGGTATPIIAAIFTKAALISGGTAGAAAGGIGFGATGPGDTVAMAPAFYPYNEENLEALNCEEFSTLP